jgi:hypothetical protein
MTQHPEFCARMLFLVAIGLFASPILAQQSSSPTKAVSTKPTPAKTSVLLIDTDDTCRLLIDDEDKGVITPDHSQKFTVPIGEHILKCTVEAVPDLVWRKVVDAKDTSQVAAVVSLKALHLQYNQAVVKVQNHESEAAVNAAKQLAEAEAAEKTRKEAIAEIPTKMLEKVKGQWRGVQTSRYMNFVNTIQMQITFESVEDGYIVAYDNNSLGVVKYWFTPMPPNKLQKQYWSCIKTKAKKGAVPGAQKDSNGFYDCTYDKPHEDDSSSIIINGNTLTLMDTDELAGQPRSTTLTR